MRDELLDRFGQIPVSVEHLLRISMIRIRGKRLYITEIKGKDGNLSFTMDPGAKLRIEGVPELLKKYGRKIAVQTKGAPAFLMGYRKTGLPDKDEENLLHTIEAILTDMEAFLLPRPEEKKA